MVILLPLRRNTSLEGKGLRFKELGDSEGKEFSKSSSSIGFRVLGFRDFLIGGNRVIEIRGSGFLLTMRIRGLSRVKVLILRFYEITRKQKKNLLINYITLYRF